jgi:ketosteroid isomerase-like protein
VRPKCVIFVFCLMSSTATGPARAQETGARAAVSETLAALVTNDFPTFANFFHDDVRGFFVDGSTMIEGFSALAFRAAYLAGLRTNVVMRDLNVRVYGNTAVSGALLGGSVTLPGGAVREGTWRYSDTRVLEEGTWKIIQYHISQLGD